MVEFVVESSWVKQSQVEPLQSVVKSSRAK